MHPQQVVFYCRMRSFANFSTYGVPVYVVFARPSMYQISTLLHCWGGRTGTSSGSLLMTYQSLPKYDVIHSDPHWYIKSIYRSLASTAPIWAFGFFTFEGLFLKLAWVCKNLAVIFQLRMHFWPIPISISTGPVEDALINTIITFICFVCCHRSPSRCLHD